MPSDRSQGPIPPWQCQDHTPSTGRKAKWEEFCADEQLRRSYNITPEELEALGQVTLLGEVRDERDFAFVLSVIRCALEHHPAGRPRSRPPTSRV